MRVCFTFLLPTFLSPTFVVVIIFFFKLSSSDFDGDLCKLIFELVILWVQKKFTTIFCSRHYMNLRFRTFLSCWTCYLVFSCITHHMIHCGSVFFNFKKIKLVRFYKVHTYTFEYDSVHTLCTHIHVIQSSHDQHWINIYLRWSMFFINRKLTQYF